MNCYSPPTKLKAMAEVVEMKVNVEGGVMRVNLIECHRCGEMKR